MHSPSIKILHISSPSLNSCSEILRGQLKDLNNLRIKVAEYNVKIKEINTLKEKINNQNKEIAQLRLKAAEADKLRKRVNELEEIKSRYEIF